jgi:MOSC domain-containing protein YiiM
VKIKRDIAMKNVGVLQSVQVGTPEQYGESNIPGLTKHAWNTSFVRVPGTQPRWLYTTHLEGNAQADTKNHGKPDQAVLLYAAAHYPHWQRELNRAEMGPGGFGENFTVDGHTEENVCIGDTYAIGEALIQVAGPRYPCWKIERRWESLGLTARVAESGRTGWYCRVLREGLIEPGVTILLVERPYPGWTVALVNDFAHSRNSDVETANDLAACPLLNEFWRSLIVRHVIKKGA